MVQWIEKSKSDLISVWNSNQDKLTRTAEFFYLFFLLFVLVLLKIFFSPSTKLFLMEIIEQRKKHSVEQQRKIQSSISSHYFVAISFDLVYPFFHADRCSTAIDFNYFHSRYFYRFLVRTRMMNVLSPIKTYTRNKFMISFYYSGIWCRKSL